MFTCEGCGQEIDPDTCGCGIDIAAHKYDQGHPFIPLGCDCYRDRPDERELYQRTEEMEL